MKAFRHMNSGRQGMVKVSVNGIHRVSRRKKDGSISEYHYAWRGGPRLKGKPGSAEYLVSLHKAREKAKLAHDPETLAGMVIAYQSSAEFEKLADHTKRDYRSMFTIIIENFGDMTTDVLDDRRVRNDFKKFRSGMIATPRKADRFWQVLKRVLNVAMDNGILRWNPAAGGGKLYHGTRADIIWTPAQIAFFLDNAPKQLVGPFLCALDTGQRQGDILAITWNQYDGLYIRLTQRKTGKPVSVRVSKRLKALLDGLERVSTHIFTTSNGTVWTSDGYQASFRTFRNKHMALHGVTFHDLRGTFITLRRREGSSIEEIASISGHSMSDVRAVLEKHYLAFDEGFGDAVILRMEK
jgi:integrase